jgi:hypothetical protein
VQLARRRTCGWKKSEQAPALPSSDAEDLTGVVDIDGGGAGNFRQAVHEHHVVGDDDDETGGERGVVDVEAEKKDNRLHRVHGEHKRTQSGKPARKIPSCLAIQG